MSMTRWLSVPAESSQDPRRAFGDAPLNTDQFTDLTLELPFFGKRQKASMVGAIFYVILLGLYAGVVVFAPWLLASIIQLLPAILCSSNVLLLALTGILQMNLAKQVKKERRQGFLHFSEGLKPLIHLPFNLVAYGNAGMLLVVAWSGVLQKIGLPIGMLLRLATVVEISFTGAPVGLYLWKVHHHNLTHLEPDAIHSLYSAVQPPTTLGDLRYLDGGRLAEQQALLLHYQQDNLRYLSEEILRLQESLSKYERSQDGNTIQVDVVHLLSAREQELRAVMAERDQNQSELRLARSLIAERDLDVLRVRSVNDKYVEENERLRAMLDEWSARTAKLELALENECLSNADLHKKIHILRDSNREST